MSMTQPPLTILDAPAVERVLRRMATEIAERHTAIDKLAFIGLHTRGIPLAQRLIKMLQSLDGGKREIPLGVLDTSFYRDDSAQSLRLPQHSETPFCLEEKNVILVDDVLFTCRTARAALDALIDMGRPPRVEFAVLIDRGGRQLPIRADYVGREVAVREDERVAVHLTEADGRDEVQVVALRASLESKQSLKYKEAA